MTFELGYTPNRPILYSMCSSKITSIWPHDGNFPSYINKCNISLTRVVKYRLVWKLGTFEMEILEKQTWYPWWKFERLSVKEKVSLFNMNIRCRKITKWTFSWGQNWSQHRQNFYHAVHLRNRQIWKAVTFLSPKMHKNINCTCIFRKLCWVTICMWSEVDQFPLKIGFLFSWGEVSRISMSIH